MDQSRRSRSQPGRSRGRLPLSAALLLALVGCESGFGSRQQGDPMLGIQSPSAPVPVPGAPSSSTAQASSGPIPPLPASYTTPGTVPVAGGETATPDKPRDLRISGDTSSPTTIPATGLARGAATGVVVGNPEPARTGAVSNLAAPTPSGGFGVSPERPAPSTGTATNIRTYEDAQRYLKQKGVNWQSLSNDEGEWKFSCGIPNPSNPRVNKTFSTKGAFPDDLSAIRAVIAEIDQTSR